MRIPQPRYGLIVQRNGIRDASGTLFSADRAVTSWNVMPRNSGVSNVRDTAPRGSSGTGPPVAAAACSSSRRRASHRMGDIRTYVRTMCQRAQPSARPPTVGHMRERLDPPLVADEKTMLDSWLDYHRDTLMMKCDGLRGDDLKRRACPPSSLSLLGLVRHLAEVERSWFRNCLAGEDAPPLFYSDEFPDGDFDLVAAADANADFATWRAEVAAARELAADRALDDIPWSSAVATCTPCAGSWCT